MPSIVTLTTDFGRESIYVAQLKAVLLTINPRLVIVDVTHEIPPQDIFTGAWTVRHSVPYFPVGSLHLAVVDPGVGTSRACLAMDWEGRLVVAPDNGLLTLLCERARPRKIVRLENRAYFRPQISATFHGRDIMAPALAWLSLGVPLEALGPPLDELVRLPGRWQPEVREREVRGQIVFVDRFGNLVTNIEARYLPQDLRVTVRMGEIVVDHVGVTYGQHAPGELIALVDSQGYLEIAVVNGSAAERTRCGLGTPVVTSW